MGVSCRIGQSLHHTRRRGTHEHAGAGAGTTARRVYPLLSRWRRLLVLLVVVLLAVRLGVLLVLWLLLVLHTGVQRDDIEVHGPEGETGVHGVGAGALDVLVPGALIHESKVSQPSSRPSVKLQDEAVQCNTAQCGKRVGKRRSPSQYPHPPTHPSP